MADPIRVTVGKRNAATSKVHQRLVFVGTEDGKLLALRQLISGGVKLPLLIFVQSIERAKQLYNEIVLDNIKCDVIHGERSSQQRLDVIQKFRAGDIWILICTDVLARGYAHE
jgi:ATP-dependent RNA helicase DDX52/ROK1